jgi:hypothetical protein
MSDMATILLLKNLGYAYSFRGSLPTSAGLTEPQNELSQPKAILPERLVKVGYMASPFPASGELKFTYQGRSAVVKVNDRGGGNGSMNRVLDLSRAAYAYLVNKSLSSITDKTASVIQLTSIVQVPATTKLGPVP